MADMGAPNRSSQFGDKRKLSRKRFFVRGKIAYDNGAQYLDCIIRDISNAGARIELPAGRVVPNHLVLIDMRNGNAHEGEVKWQTAPQLGMAFVRSFTLDGPVAPEDSYLKRLWSGSLRVIDPDVPSGQSAPHRK